MKMNKSRLFLTFVLVILLIASSVGFVSAGKIKGEPNLNFQYNIDHATELLTYSISWTNIPVQRVLLSAGKYPYTAVEELDHQFMLLLPRTAINSADITLKKFRVDPSLLTQAAGAYIGYSEGYQNSDPTGPEYIIILNGYSTQPSAADQGHVFSMIIKVQDDGSGFSYETAGPTYYPF